MLIKLNDGTEIHVDEMQTIYFVDGKVTILVGIEQWEYEFDADEIYCIRMKAE